MSKGINNSNNNGNIVSGFLNFSFIKGMDKKDKKEILNAIQETYTSLSKSISNIGNNMDVGRECLENIIIKQALDIKNYQAVEFKDIKNSQENIHTTCSQILDNIKKVTTENEDIKKFLNILNDRSQEQDKKLSELNDTIRREATQNVLKLDEIIEFLNNITVKIDEVSKFEQEQNVKLAGIEGTSEKTLAQVLQYDEYFKTIIDMQNKCNEKHDLCIGKLNEIKESSQAAGKDMQEIKKQLGAMPDKVMNGVIAIMDKYLAASKDASASKNAYGMCAYSAEELINSTFNETLKNLDDNVDTIKKNVEIIANKLKNQNMKLDALFNSVKSIGADLGAGLKDIGADIRKILSILHKVTFNYMENDVDCDICHSSASARYCCSVCNNKPEFNRLSENGVYKPYKQIGVKGGLLVINKKSCGSTDFNIHKFFNGHNFKKGEVNRVTKILVNSDIEYICLTKDDDQLDEFLDKQKTIKSYFPNLQIISFAKSASGQAQYIIGAGVFADHAWEHVGFYGGKFIKDMEKYSFALKDEKEVNDLKDDLYKRIDPTGELHTRMRNEKEEEKGDWREPYPPHWKNK